MSYKCINLKSSLFFSLMLAFVMNAEASEEKVLASANATTKAGFGTSAQSEMALADTYEVQPGDVLFVSVWGEPQLQLDVLVGPDGGFSLPLAGEITARNKPLSSIRLEVTEKLKKYIPDADVTVALKQIQGNKVYVIGKVNRPGDFVLNRNVDVMQALSMAGGTAQFADVDNIIILRRIQNAQQVVFKFDYGEVKKGRKLQQNIVLQSGDVVVVP